jgi:two-component system LytT family response regulator
MPEVDGFEVLESVGLAAMPEVIFVTAHEQYTLRAFEVHALDYVLKPFDQERLWTAVEHARARVTEGRDAAFADRLASLLEELRSGPPGVPGATREAPYARRLTVRKGDRTRFVRLEDVDWIEAARNYVQLHVGEESYLVRTSLKGLLQRLDPALFVRIHRSAVVNLERIREVQPWVGGDYVVLLEDGQTLRVSRTYRDRLLRIAH